MLIARQGELGFELRFVQPLSHLEFEGVAGQERGRRQSVQRGGGRDEHHVGLPAGDAPQGGQSFADEILVRREAVVGQGFPIGEQHASQLGCKEGHFIQQSLGIQRVGRDHGHAPALRALALGQAGQPQGVPRARRAGQGETLANGESRELHEAEGGAIKRRETQ